jgi:hypothetical protein
MPSHRSMPAVLLSGVLALLLLLAGCGGGHDAAPATPAEPAPYVPIPIVAGPASTHALTGTAGQTVPLGIGDAALVLPDGATGRLTLAPIVSGPPRPAAGGHGVAITAPAGARLQLRLSVPAGGVARCYRFGSLPGCLDDSLVPRTDRWAPIPDISLAGGIATVELTSPARTRQGDPTVNIWIGDPNSEGELLALRQRLLADIDALLALLPDPTRTTAMAAYQGAMRPMVERSSEADGSYYAGFAWWDATRAVPYFGLRLSSADDILAHECGHYLSHLLAGSAAFRPIFDLAPDADHGLGKQYGGRTTITEEYAYFAQFLRLGHVNFGDPSIGGWLGGIVRQNPAAIDYPSLEGFGCALMAALTRTSAGAVADFNSYLTRVKTPTPAGALTGGEVLASYASGASKIDALATALETRMIEHKQGAAFQVIAERLGWSYHVTGHIVSNKLPVQGVKVTPVLIVTQNNVTTTYTASTATTDASGIYHLPRAFFGKALLRIEYGSQSYEVPYTVDRTKATVVTQTIPDIDIDFDIRPFITAVTPDAALADEVVTITGGNFGATQPAGTKLALLRPAYGAGIIEPEILSWSNATITIRAPRAVDSPVQVSITNMQAYRQNLWLYLGDGSTWLNKMKQYQDICVAYVHNPVSPFDSINGYSDVIGLSMPYMAVAHPDCPVIRNLTWNGAAFTGTWRISNYYLTDPDFGKMGPVSEEITITGTLDPVRRRLINITADMHQESFLYLDHDDGTPNTMTVQLKLKELSGSINEGQRYAAFGIYQSMQSGYPPTPVSRDNVVSYHYVRTGDNPIEFFTNDYNSGNIWESREQMYVLFDNPR